MMLHFVRTNLISAALSFYLLHPSNAQGGLEPSGFTIVPETTAVVITDPQNDFLAEEGVAWGLVGASVEENDTIKNIAKLMAAAKEGGMLLFVSPHYYFPHDHKWDFEGTLEKAMHNIHMFDRAGQLDMTDFEGSGSDWLEELKGFIEDEDTIVSSPHKLYGPETNDLVLQLRKRGIDKIILGGMSANLCTESHMRELIEQGFEVLVVKDATAAAKAMSPEGENLDGYKAALINFKMIASDVWTTEETVDAMMLAAGVSNSTKTANVTATEKGGNRKFRG